MTRRFLAATLFSLLAALSGCSKSDHGAATGNRAVALTENDRTQGNPDAPIEIVEYAAPSCPVCARFNNETFPSLKANYIAKGKVFYVFRVFPIGPQDLPAEALARCMPKDGYFPFIDLLFKNQEVWDPEFGITNVQAGLIEVAQTTGMSIDRATQCMQDQAELDRIQKDAEAAQKTFNIQATPTFFINGQKQVGGLDKAAFAKLLDGVLPKS